MLCFSFVLRYMFILFKYNGRILIFCMLLNRHFTTSHFMTVCVSMQIAAHFHCYYLRAVKCGFAYCNLSMRCVK